MAISKNIMTRNTNLARANIMNMMNIDNTNADSLNEVKEFVALRNVTIRINTALEMGKRSELVVAANLALAKAEIADIIEAQKSTNRAFVSLPWSDVREYAFELFGMQKSVAYNLAQVGTRFLNSDGSVKREYDALSDCSVSVLGLLVPLKDEEIHDLVSYANETGKRLTASFVRDCKKALKSGNIHNEIEPASEPANEPANEPATITDVDITFEPAPMDNFDVIAKDGTLKVIIHRASGDIVSEFDRRDKENVIAYLSRLF